MSGRGNKAAIWAGAATAAALALLPAVASGKPGQDRRPPAVSISFDRINAFTPATADPKLAAAFANRGNSMGDFKFTPAAPKGRPSQVRVAIRARSDSTAAAATPAIGALAQASYNLGVSVGWRRFAVTGDVAKSGAEALGLGGKESALVGINYSLGKRATARVAAGTERTDGTRAPALGSEQAYSLDVGGAYKLTRNIAVTGGVRYKVENERIAPLQDQRRDSQAVYVGTAFKF